MFENVDKFDLWIALSTWKHILFYFENNMQSLNTASIDGFLYSISTGEIFIQILFGVFLFFLHKATRRK